MIVASICLLLAFNPADQVRHVDVDIIELNHIVHAELIDETIPGKARYKLSEGALYWNFWQWHPAPVNAYHVRDWYSASNPRVNVTYQAGRPVIRFDRQGVTFVIRGRVFLETWTFDDPEIADGKIWAHENRRIIHGLRLGN